MTQTSRRRFLASSAALGLAALANESVPFERSAAQTTSNRESGGRALIPIVDTHQHLWDISKLRLPGLETEDSKPLRRNFLLPDYEQATAHANVVKTVYMEVACDPSQKRIEADYVLKLCRNPGSRLRGAVIGAVMRSNQFRPYIEEYAQNPFVKGARMILNSRDLPRGTCLERVFVDNARLLGSLGLSFDLCMRPNELLDGVRLAERCPGTRFIVDHCGNMDVETNDRKLRSEWERGIKGAAARPNMVCKISGIVATAKPKVWKASDLAPYVDFCLDSFGENRVFFGGDWPVCTLKATYQQWVDALKRIVAKRSPEFRQKLFHDNAVRFYKLT